MPAKSTPRKSAPKARPLKENRTVYVVTYNASKRTRAKQNELEFHITLPSNADAEAFTDKLIELVEAHDGTVAGGTVTAREQA